ncbi:MAG: SAM-dependent methyltransferase [Fusobacteriaceae bacterium]|nr:SAM-dependent methyltransferase [Fusobacteriaceae bacterium]
MKISNKLKKISEYIPKNSLIADIGTDHGILPAYILEAKITSKVIATDINVLPLEKAKKSFKNIDFRLGDGLNPINSDELDTVVISGMGGDTMIKILSNLKRKSINTLILSPNTQSYRLRKFLTKHSFYITNETLVLDKKHIYEIIVLKQGKRRYSFKELWIGPKILEEKSDFFNEKYKEKLKKYNSFYKKMPFSIEKLKTKIKILILTKEVSK